MWIGAEIDFDRARNAVEICGVQPVSSAARPNAQLNREPTAVLNSHRRDGFPSLDANEFVNFLK